jgi:hypothetical protein
MPSVILGRGLSSDDAAYLKGEVYLCMRAKPDAGWITGETLWIRCFQTTSDRSTIPPL